MTGLLGKAFGKKTRNRIIGDFEKHFDKNNEKVARKNKETIKSITRVKWAFDKKRIARKEKEVKAKNKNINEYIAEEKRYSNRHQ